MKVPTVQTLRDAIDAVVGNNKSEGYVPTRFMGKTGDKAGIELRLACNDLLSSVPAEEAVLEALQAHPRMWTLEDFVLRQGATWGFGQEALRAAQRRVEAFDAIRMWSGARSIGAR